jgi:hypothetical protein
VKHLSTAESRLVPEERSSEEIDATARDSLGAPFTGKMFVKNIFTGGYSH